MILPLFTLTFYWKVCLRKHGVDLTQPLFLQRVWQCNLCYKIDSVNCLVMSDYLVTSYHFLFISLWSGLITCSSLPAFGFWSGFFNFISRLNRKPFKHSSDLQLGVCHKKYLAPEIDHSQNRFPTKLKTEVGMTACKKTCV